LGEDALLKVFELPNWKEIIKEYIKSYSIPYSVEVKLFEQKDVHDLILQYVESGKRLYPKSQLRILELSNWEVIIKTYMKHHYLSHDTEVMILKSLENAEDFVCEYSKIHSLSPDAQIMLFELPKAEALVEAYTRNRPLAKEAEPLMFKLSNAESLVKHYVEAYPNFLCPEAQEMVFDLSNVAEIMRIYLSLFNVINQDKILGQAAQIKLFSLAEAKELVKIYISKCKMSADAEVFMIDVLDYNDIETYIQKYMLGVKAQLKLLKMTKK
jgi:hypothetical protein